MGNSYFRRLRLPALLAATCTVGSTQQTGVIIRRPGSPSRTPPFEVHTVPPPKPSCITPSSLRSTGEGVPQVPDMFFTREGLTCIRHTAGTLEQVARLIPGGVLSPKGDEIAYWSSSGHALHLYALANGVDTLLDALPSAAALSRISWSEKGRTIVYAVKDHTPLQIHYINLENGRRGILDLPNARIQSVPDDDHLLTLLNDSVQFVRLSDGAAETLAHADLSDAAGFSVSGKLLGVLASSPGNSAAATSPDSDDDGPDCAGGSFALIVFDFAGKRRIQVPFPSGFDTVLDYDFSPDDRTVAVTFGVTGCDYPGDAAQVFVISLSSGTPKRVSPKDRLSVQVHWSPDGKTLVYTDYTGSDASLFAVDPETRKFVRLTDPGTNGPDQFLAWR